MRHDHSYSILPLLRYLDTDQIDGFAYSFVPTDSYEPGFALTGFLTIEIDVFRRFYRSVVASLCPPVKIYGRKIRVLPSLRPLLRASPCDFTTLQRSNR
jgi:hypothetical protein